MPVTLSSMPEEILERILELVVTPSSPSLAHRPSWHPYPGAPRPQHTRSAASPSPRIPPHLAPLLVSHTWLRIATPLHYRHVVLRSARQTALLAATLRASPDLGHWVRSVRTEGTFDALPDVVRLCPNVEGFDMTVDNGAVVPGAYAVPSPVPAHALDQGAADAVDQRVARFCSAFRRMRRIKHLVIRKNAYLTQPRPALIFEELAKAITGWTHLETVNIAFRFSPSPASASFAASLAAAPKLRDVSALLPAVWNTTLLEISANPSLERIHLTPDTELMGAHLFLSEARKHPRLIELIRAGTPIMRMRARTTTAIPLASTGPVPAGAQCPPAPRSPPPSPPVHYPTRYAAHGPTPNRAPAHAHAQPRVKPEHAARREQPGHLPPLGAAQMRNTPSARRMSAV